MKDAIEVGDKVSWADLETGIRTFGNVLAKRKQYYIVTNSRGVVALKPNRIVKECG